MSEVEHAWPSVSVDRAAGHLYKDSFEVHFDDISKFYDSIPLDDKPPIEGCHIHFTSLANVNRVRNTVGYGVRRLSGKSYAPQDTPDADIVVFLGSLAGFDPEEERRTKTSILSHELVHFAQRGRVEDDVAAQLSVDEAIDLASLYLQRGWLQKLSLAGRFAATSAITHVLSEGVELASDGLFESDWRRSALAGALITTIRRVRSRNERQENQVEARERLFARYEGRPHEVEARDIPDMESDRDLVNAELRDGVDSTRILAVRQNTSMVFNKVVLAAHKRLVNMPVSEAYSPYVNSESWGS